MIKHLPALVNVFVNAFTYNFYLLRRCLEILPESRCLPGRNVWTERAYNNLFAFHLFSALYRDFLLVLFFLDCFTNTNSNTLIFKTESQNSL